MRLAAILAVCLGSVLARPASAEDAVVPPPSLYLRQMVGAAGWPSGLISDTRLQYRIPLHRSPSIVFRDTFAGFGGRVRATPAFVDVGPRISLAPIDVFDVEFQGAWIYYWPSSSGLLPYDYITDSTLERIRRERHDDDASRARAGWALTASAQPTLKAKVGPIIVLDAWNFQYFHIDRPSGTHSAYVYEPFWDRIIAWDDLVFDHQAVVLAELLDGVSTPQILRVGALFRHEWVLESKDSTMQLGGVVMFEPSPRPAWPTLAVQVTAYLRDPDRVGGPPATGFAAIWEFTK